MSDRLETSISMGLDSIFSVEQIAIKKTNHYEQYEHHQKKIITVDINNIKPSPYQARKTFSEKELQELSQSIISYGILQPLTARKIGDSYELIAGERRLRASKLAGLTTVPVICCDVSNETSMAFGLIENIQRENLNIIEEAHAYKKLIDDFQLTHEKISELVGKSRAAISNSIRLLNLADSVKELLMSKKIEMGHARALLALPLDKQDEVAEMVILKNYTVRDVESYIKNNSKNHFMEKPVARLALPNLKEYEDELYYLLGSKASVNVNHNGKGEIRIPFNSIDDFNRMLKRIHDIIDMSRRIP